MCDALIRLRDLSEKRVAPACQRLHIVLQEVQGWAALCVSVSLHCPFLLNRTVTRPQYAVCNFKPFEVEACLEYTASAIFQASWLASVTRKELLRFKEFMKWIRYGTCVSHYHNLHLRM